MIDQAVSAINQGRPVVLPTDTVYGLMTTPLRAEPVERLYRLKGRAAVQPTALIAPDIDSLLELLPELRGDTEVLVRTLLPGALTLVLPNPARRFLWLTGTTAEAIGVRVANLPDAAADVLRQVGALAATSANLAGGADPARLDDVPREILDGVAVAIDGGELPGVPSTVIDLSGPEPKVLREGAVSGAEAVERALAAYS